MAKEQSGVVTILNHQTLIKVWKTGRYNPRGVQFLFLLSGDPRPLVSSVHGMLYIFNFSTFAKEKLDPSLGNKKWLGFALPPCYLAFLYSSFLLALFAAAWCTLLPP